MEQNLSALIDRLEKVVQRVELKGLIERLDDVVTRSEAVQGAPAQQPAQQPSQQQAAPVSAPSQAQSALVKQWQSDVISKLKDLNTATQALKNDFVTDAVAKYSSCLHLQTATLTALDKFAKPVTPGGDALAFLCAKIQVIGNEVGTVKQKNFKSPPNHLQVVIDSLNMFNYPFYSLDDLKEVIEDTCN